MKPEVVETLSAIRLHLEGKMACEGCGCELMEEDAYEGDEGEMLCEECWEEEYGDDEDEEEMDEAVGKDSGSIFHFLLAGDEKFAFHAKDEKEARSKIMGWLKKQGMMPSKNDIEIKIGPGSYKNNVHDEWMESLDESCQCENEGLNEKAMSKFKKLVAKLKKRGDVESPEGLAAWIGAKKMGKGNVEKGRKMLQKMAVKARKAR
jgi:hypothetical protein